MSNRKCFILLAFDSFEFMCPQKNEIKVAFMQPLNLQNNFWNFNLEREKNRFCMFFAILIVWFEHFKD